ncbi:SAM-dependent methyltransferase [Mycobacterium asiaticum]|uniref:S-adenosyl-L-methionine-dependent methyltransferase n=1 Tax=Mycobacterium asiaticum TaxID=1790 RepID=A0A1A3MK85_MYCAS|nr:SAM-dependent methyltransferase [Mycobacterium asiaticum]OBK09906.1 methyltransferase [Mycobacterium asiaticum]
MARNPAARTAFGPMLLAAVEQNEPPDRRLVDDDLAELFLPAPLRWLAAATQVRAIRRALIGASELTGRGLWANLACRKRFIGDKLAEAADQIDAVVILGAGLDTRAYQLNRRIRRPVFEVDLPVNVARKAKTVRRVLGELPLSVRLVALNFEQDDLLTALAEHGYRTDYRVFLIWEGVTQYLTEDAVRTTLDGLRPTAPGSHMVFSYVRRDFIDGTNLYGSRTLYRSVRKRQQLWHFGIQPEEIASFLEEYGWRLIEQVGPDDLVARYVGPTGRKLSASQIEWSAYAEKV